MKLTNLGKSKTPSLNKSTMPNLSNFNSELALNNSTSDKLFKLKNTPSGRKLWTYMAAILEVTGMDKGNPYPLNKFFGNFKTHLDNGRILRVSEGYQLTPSGIEYFNDRYKAGNKQHIERAEVDTMKHFMIHGDNDEWTKLT